MICHRSVYFVLEGLAIKTLVENNKAAVAKWNTMEDEEKHRYHQLAAQVPIVTPDVPVYDKWHETQESCPICRTMYALFDCYYVLHSLLYFIGSVNGLYTHVLCCL